MSFIAYFRETRHGWVDKDILGAGKRHHPYLSNGIFLFSKKMESF